VRGDAEPAIEAVKADLHTQTTVPALLAATARSVVALLEASACTISRVIGDMLVELVDYDVAGRAVQIGHGYLVSDFPLTLEVLEKLEPRTVFLGDPDADEKEAALLRALGFDSLLMLAIQSEGRPWALVEVYADGRRFGPDDTDAAQRVLVEAGEVIDRLERGG
jgi:hypothetical protein